MVEVVEVILCCIGICAVIGVVMVVVADMAKTRSEEKRNKKKMLDSITAKVNDISRDLSDIKSILEDR